jgi:hypothetical protein
MPASTIAVFNEPAAFDAALQQGCSVDLLVTEQGQFRAELITIVLPRLRLLRGKEWLSRIATVLVAPRSLLIILPIEPEQPQACGGVTAPHSAPGIWLSASDDAMATSRPAPNLASVHGSAQSCRQTVEQRSSLLKIGPTEALAESRVNGCQRFARLIGVAASEMHLG